MGVDDPDTGNDDLKEAATDTEKDIPKMFREDPEKTFSRLYDINGLYYKYRKISTEFPQKEIEKIIFLSIVLLKILIHHNFRVLKIKLNLGQFLKSLILNNIFCKD